MRKVHSRIMALVQKKNGGPDTKDEQRKRRDEVYRLHFDYGLSAREIAKLLDKSRGTINRDVMYWDVNIAGKWRHLDPVIFVKNQVERLNIQRTRLRKHLDNTESLQEEISIERFIFNIDIKIANFQIRLVEAQRNIEKQIVNGINEYFERERNEKRIISPDVFLEVSEKARERITNIYKEDMKF